MAPSNQQIFQQVSNDQLEEIGLIIIEYFNSFNYLETIYDGEFIPDGITMGEIPNVLNIIINYAFHSTPQQMPNIIAFMNLENISFNIETLAIDTIHIMKQKIINGGFEIEDNISRDKLVMLYARVFMNNTDFWHTHIMYNSQYDIDDDDDDDEDD